MKYLTLFLLALVCGGCGQLTIVVKSLDPKFMQSEDWNEAAAERDGTRVRALFAKASDGVTTNFEAAITQFLHNPDLISVEQTSARTISVHEANLETLTDTKDVPSLDNLILKNFGAIQENVEARTKAVWAKATEDYQKGLNDLDLAVTLNPGSKERSSQFASARQNFLSGDQGVQSLSSTTKDAFGFNSDLMKLINRTNQAMNLAAPSTKPAETMVPSASKTLADTGTPASVNPVPTTLPAATKTLAGAPAPVAPVPSPANPALVDAVKSAQAANTAASKTVSAVVDNIAPQVSDSIIEGAGIGDDVLEPLISSADDRYWTHQFNFAYGWGIGGNTDIAVRMDGIGDFAVKGVRVDSSKVTAATFAGVREAVSLAAAAYGVPVPGLSQTGTGAITSTGTNTDADTTAADDTNRAHAARLKAAKGAAASLLQDILNEKDALADANKSAAALARVQAEFAAYRAQLSPSK